MYLVCMHVCCFCYMYSRFEKLCRACVLCMLWYVSTLNKTLFIYLFIYLPLLHVTHKTSIYTNILYSVTYILILFLLVSKGPVILLFMGMLFLSEPENYHYFIIIRLLYFYIFAPFNPSPKNLLNGPLLTISNSVTLYGICL